jgi:hypothetical protein
VVLDGKASGVGRLGLDAMLRAMHPTVIIKITAYRFSRSPFSLIF